MPGDPNIALSIRNPEPFNGIDLGKIRAQQQDAELRAQQIEAQKGLAQERQMKVTADQRLQEQNAKLDTMMQGAFTADPDSGIFTFDRGMLEQSMVQGGMGHLLPTMTGHMDALDASAKKRAAEGRVMVAQTLVGIEDAGDTADALLSGAAYLQKNGVITADKLAPMLQAVAADPTPANIKALRTQLGGALPEYQALVTSRAKGKSDLAHQEAQTGKLVAETAQIGKPPEMTPYQQAQLAGQDAGRAEAARHNRGMEANAARGRDPRKELTPNAEANVTRQYVNQWTAASKPVRDLDRQVALIDAGMTAARRGDLAQGAQTVLVAFQKILDPTSVVREAEFDRSAAGQSLYQRVQGAAEQLARGGAGIPLEQLEKFHTLAKEASQAQRGAYLSSVKERIGKAADRYNIPRELIFEATPESAAPAAAGPKKIGRFVVEPD